MSASTKTIPFWKKINQTVSGFTKNITQDIVTEILELSEPALFEGLLSYKSYCVQSFKDWTPGPDVDDYMKEFTHELSLELNLDTELTYAVLCNYLMFEYYGKIKEFKKITKTGTTAILKEGIWSFYVAERMFLLKTWRHILEYMTDAGYEFSQQYKQFLTPAKVADLQKGLIEQLEYLINEICDTYYKKNTCKDMWLMRINREQIEILQILMLTSDQSAFTTKQFTTILRLFLKNYFINQPAFVECAKNSMERDVDELLQAQISCYLVLFENFWKHDLTDLANFWKDRDIAQIGALMKDVCTHPAHQIVSMCWLLLKTKSAQSDADEAAIAQIIDERPFNFLFSIVNADMFKNCRVGRVMLRATHKFLDELCLRYDDRKGLFQQEAIIQIAQLILTQPDLAEICLQTRNGFDNIVALSFETFPYDFLSLTTIAHSLLALPEHSQKAIDLLNNVPAFLSDSTWTVAREDLCHLQTPQRAFSDSNLIVFGPQTPVRAYAIFDRNLIQYRGAYSYFTVLEYFMDLMLELALQDQKFDPILFNKATAGYSVVIQVIKYCRDVDLSTCGVKGCLQKLEIIMLHVEGPLLFFPLVQLYYEVQTAMITYRQISMADLKPENVFNFIFPKIKIEYLIKDNKEWLYNTHIFEGSVFMEIFQYEHFKQDHRPLLAYLDLVQSIIEGDFAHEQYQHSCIAFVLNLVFVQHRSWTYGNQNIQTKITLACLKIFYLILSQDTQRQKIEPHELRAFELCYHAFVDCEPIIDSFMTLFIKPKNYLTVLMECEPNWINGRSLHKLESILVQLKMLLLIMKFRINAHNRNLTCVVDQKVCHIVKPVASFFVNCYNTEMAELACRYLEKLAEDRKVRLLALLELDHYQVQALFLERLRDPLEEDSVKLAIIDLINACVSNQDGMTAAFFNLKCFMYWDGVDEQVTVDGDTVSDFMVDYLQNIKKSHEYFKNPLQLGILRLLQNLWLCHRENLIENIAGLRDFWPVMMAPFFCDFVQEVEVYSLILSIVNLEVNAEPNNVDSKLIDTIVSFLRNEEQLKGWLEYLSINIVTPEKANVELLYSWMEFIILVKKVVPDGFTRKSHKMIGFSCLDGLNSAWPAANEVEVVYFWTQLYLLIIESWWVYGDEEDIVIDKLSSFLQIVIGYYKYLSPHIKENILCVINKTIVDLSPYLSYNIACLFKFLHPVGTIIDTEYTNLVNSVWNMEDQEEKIKALKPWLIILFIGNSILSLEVVKDLNLWFAYRNFVSKVMHSIETMLKDRATLPFVKLTIYSLIAYSESPLRKDFNNLPMSQFYAKFRPPNITISVTEAILSGVPASLKEWWLIFTALVKLNRTQLDKLGLPVHEICYTFFAQHHKTFQEIICLGKNTVDITALTLVSETFKLIYSLQCLRPYWCVEMPEAYKEMINGIKTTMNASILSILGSKKINFYHISGKSLRLIDTAPADLLASVLNNLIEIVYWAANCLKKAKPDLDNILYDNIEPSNALVLIDNDFSVPRFQLPITANLSYGTLLCLAHYLCKVLNQLNPNARSTSPSRARQVFMTHLEDEIKLRNLGAIFEHCTDTYEEYIGFMVYMQKSDDMPNEKLSSFLHYDMSEFSTLPVSPVLQLDYFMVKSALESLMGFLAGEIFYTIKHVLQDEALFYYKRELCSELQFFYEYVRKHMSDTSVTTPMDAGLQKDVNSIRNYMLSRHNETVENISDTNYVLILAQWLVKFCELPTN